MTNAQPSNDIERRLSRLENLMSSSGKLFIQTASLARRNAADFDRMLETLNRVVVVTERNTSNIEALTQDIRQNAADIQTMSQRVNSLAAASERHDRILDYLLKREVGDIESE